MACEELSVLPTLAEGLRESAGECFRRSHLGQYAFAPAFSVHAYYRKQDPPLWSCSQKLSEPLTREDRSAAVGRGRKPSPCGASSCVLLPSTPAHGGMF